MRLGVVPSGGSIGKCQLGDRIEARITPGGKRPEILSEYQLDGAAYHLRIGMVHMNTVSGVAFIDDHSRGRVRQERFDENQ
jgi:hypothetical protein